MENTPILESVKLPEIPKDLERLGRNGLAPNFKKVRLTERYLKSLKKKQKKYLNGQKRYYVRHKLTDMGDLDINVINESFDEGAKLWQQIVDAVLKKFENPDDSAAICYKVKQLRWNKFEVCEYDNKNGKKYYKGCYYLSRKDRHERLRNGFANFCNSVKLTKNINRYERALFVTGEGDMLLRDPDKFLDSVNGLRECENISCLAGPIMVRDDDDEYLNNFIKALVKNQNKNKEKSVRTELSLWKNLIMPVEKLYAGLFHCYVVGNTIFAEAPHGMLHDKGYAYRFIFEDENCADAIENFFFNKADDKKCFVENFAVKIVDKCDEKLKEYYPTINMNTEELGARAFRRHYKKEKPA